MHKYGFKIFWSDEDDAYIVTCPEFPGLSAFGDTEEEALREAKVALELFIESMQEHNEPLPVPQPAHTYSGQFRVRLPRTLHRQLAERAEDEGVSLNALVMTYLSAGVAVASSVGQLDTPFRVSQVAVAQQALTDLSPASVDTHFGQAEIDHEVRGLIDSVCRVPEGLSAANNQELALAA